MSASDALVAAAREARERAFAPYSTFKVGAALETADGVIITGCNIENASYGLTICAERVAMFKAIADGHRHFVRIVVVADTSAPTAPCGACRQVLSEFAPDLEITLANLTQVFAQHTIRELLPHAFGPSLLDRR
ncbi:MAG: cytidine deaminase [Acidobacteria bacterium]|nr:cytidine deaminase [Acidobacteriota bacterium]